MKNRRLLIAAVALISLGFFLMMGGLLVDSAFAGLPPQDPPPDVAMATTLFLLGGGLASLGALAAVALAFLTIKAQIKGAGDPSSPEH